MDDHARIERAVGGRLHELAGEASMCWEPTPTGGFDAGRAARAAERAAGDVARIILGEVVGGAGATLEELRKAHDEVVELERQINRLAAVILEEFGGPGPGPDGARESAVEAAIRFLREARPPAPDFEVAFGRKPNTFDSAALSGIAGLLARVTNEFQRHAELGPARLVAEVRIRREHLATPAALGEGAFPGRAQARLRGALERVGVYASVPSCGALDPPDAAPGPQAICSNPVPCSVHPRAPVAASTGPVAPTQNACGCPTAAHPPPTCHPPPAQPVPPGDPLAQPATPWAETTVELAAPRDAGEPPVATPDRLEGMTFREQLVELNETEKVRTLTWGEAKLREWLRERVHVA